MRNQPLPALLAASAAVLVAAVVAAAYLTPRGSVAYLLAAWLLTETMVVTTLAVAGIVLRSLSPAVLLALSLAWPLALAVVVRLRGAPHRWRERVGAAGATLRTTLADPLVLVAAGIMVATLLWRAFLALRLPVVDFDGWSYHLVFLDVWLQHDALTLVPHRPWTAGYPPRPAARAQRAVRRGAARCG